MEVLLQGSIKVTWPSPENCHDEYYNMYYTIRSGQALCFSPFFFHSSPEVSFLKPERGGGEIEVRLVGVEVLVATLVELEKPVRMYVCVCTIIVRQP